MKTEKWFASTIRYEFDGGMCSSSRGWAQFDTREDASYYGIWINPFDLTIFTYTEGDCYFTEAETEEEFIQVVKEMIKSYSFIGIDPGFNTGLKDKP